MSAGTIKRGLIALALLGPWQSLLAELPAEPMPSIQTMPAQYPDSLIFAHDANFAALIAGKVVAIDVAPENKNYLGAMDAAQFASFVQSAKRQELYVAETHYSRGTRGNRSDVVTIYDQQNLKPIDEVVLPGAKRGLVVSHRYSIALIGDDEFLAVFNFTPAASVSLIDLNSRKIVSETQIPGCALVYPSGKRGFSSLCGNGAIYTAQFDQSGQLLSQDKVPPFFNVDQDPLFDKPIYYRGQAHFPSYKGKMQALDLRGSKPKVKPSWPLVTKKEAKQNWRPGGWQIASVDDAGRAYIIMHKDGFDGSHKSGGSDIWVYDLKKQKRLKKFVLKNWAVSVEITRGKNPYMVVTNGDMQLDVYRARDGKWLKMIGGAAAMPFTLHAVKK